MIPWLSKTAIIVIVYALGKPHPKSGTIWGWKEQLLTFQDNHYDLAADMTQHEESDNKNEEKKRKTVQAGFKCCFKTSTQVCFQGESFSTRRVGQLHPSSNWVDWAAELWTCITKSLVCVGCNPNEKKNNCLEEFGDIVISPHFCEK